MLPKAKPRGSIFGGLPSLPEGMDASALQGILTGMPNVAQRPPERPRKKVAGGIPLYQLFASPDREDLIGTFKNRDNFMRALAQLEDPKSAISSEFSSDLFDPMDLMDIVDDWDE